MGISDYSTNPLNNADIDGIDISEGCNPAGVNNAIRQLMADIAVWSAQGLRRVAAPTGVAATDTANIQASIDLGLGIVQLSEGTYVCNNVTLKNGVVLAGAGKWATVLQSADSSADPVVTSDNFAALSGSNSWSSPNGNKYGFGLKDLGINGNKSGGATGNGLEVHGQGLHFENCIIFDCGGIGYYSESGTGSGQAGTIDMPEGWVNNIEIRNCDGKGMEYRGPHNAVLGKIISAFNGDWGIHFAKDDDAATGYDGNIDTATHIHTYGNDSEKGVLIEAVVHLASCITDGDCCSILGSNASSSRITRFKNINGGKNRSPLAVTAGNITVDDAFISMDPDALAGFYGVDSSANDFTISHLYLSGNSADVNGVRLAGNRGEITGGAVTSCGDGTNANGGGRGVRISGAASRVNLRTIACDTHFAYVPGSRNRVTLTCFTTSSEALTSGSGPVESDVFEIVSYGDTVGYTEQRGVESGEVSLDVVGQTTLNIPHELIYTPPVERVQVSMKEGTSGAIGDGAFYHRVVSTDATNVVVQFVVTTASATSGAKASVVLRASV